MIVTIDGPAGSGKSTVARRLAGRLGFRFLDTGAMYRAVGLHALRSGIDLADAEAVARVAASVDLHVDHGRILLNGEDVSDAVRSPEASRAASLVAVVAGVREVMVRLQREVAGGFDMVTEGRDQGTVAFPDAACKFYVTATPEERARRRLQDLARQGREATFDETLAEIRERDARDEGRAVAPLRPADDALVVDTSGMELDDVVATIERHVRSAIDADRQLRFPPSRQ